MTAEQNSEKEFTIEHYDEQPVVPPRLGRFSLADVKLLPQQALKVLGVPLALAPILKPEAAFAYIQ